METTTILVAILTQSRDAGIPPCTSVVAIHKTLTDLTAAMVSNANNTLIHTLL